jgi:hypothetical protein
MFVDGRERREVETPPDFLQAWSVPVLLNELVEEIEYFALTFGEWQHPRTIDKGKAKVN